MIHACMFTYIGTLLCIHMYTQYIYIYIHNIYMSVIYDMCISQAEYFSIYIYIYIYILYIYMCVCVCPLKLPYLIAYKQHLLSIAKVTCHQSRPRPPNDLRDPRR